MTNRYMGIKEYITNILDAFYVIYIGFMGYHLQVSKLSLKITKGQY